MRKQRILVVEDHQLLLNAIRDLLEESYEVLTAHDGREALEVMEENLPDLVLSDIMMPQMNGYDLYEKVRANPAWVRIPFIFLTARGERGDIIRGKALGVEDYLTKPFDTEELMTTINSRLQRAKAIQQASENEFEQIKQQIVNVLSHELRTPLTYISGYTELALDDISSLTAEELQDFLIRIKRGSDRLNKLVEDLLMGVQLDTGRTAQEFASFASVRHDLDKIIKRIVQMQQHNAQAQEVTLTLTVETALPPAYVYEDFIANALERLIDNAIKFSRTPPCEVMVKARANEDWVEIDVIDHGVGIAEEDLASVFVRFQQVNRQKMEQQGTGMGLFIAKSLTELHNGDIFVQSTLGKGSTFTLKLPVHHEAA